MGLGQLIMAGVGAGVCEAAKVHSGQAALGRWRVHNALKCFPSSSEAELFTSKKDGAGDVWKLMILQETIFKNARQFWEVRLENMQNFDKGIFKVIVFITALTWIPILALLKKAGLLAGNEYIV